MRRTAIFGALGLALCACTHATPVARATPTPPASHSPTRAPSPSASPVAACSPPSATEAMRLDHTVASTFASREAASSTFARAARWARAMFTSNGYMTRLLPVPVRAGKVNGTTVAAGTTYDVIAEPPSYDPRARHVVVGAHLDSVPGTPGANDDGSGVALTLALARATRQNLCGGPVAVPVVYVLFGAEERRRQSPSESEFAIGSKAYLSSLQPAERKSIAAAFILDMVSVGARVHLLGSGGALLGETIATARAQRIDAFADSSRYFSDHVSFEDAHIPVVWFYSGDDPVFHTPRDIYAHLQRAEVDRIGRLVWYELKNFRG